MSGTPPKFFRPAPLLGENTEEVLAKLGYSETAIKDLRAKHVI
jgi:crotonobetainyl-CoA:carnitine CoA-transferase CaiB-like acyl-CoA transferase